MSNIKSKGYAGKDEQETMASWNFERRPVGDSEIKDDIQVSWLQPVSAEEYGNANK